jgi:peptide/nickel transport system substrate-binding protein
MPRTRLVSLAAALAALAAGGAAAGCDDGGGAGARGAAPDPAGERPADALVVELEPARPGGFIVVGSLADPKSFNPIVASETSTTEVLHQIFEHLVEIDCVTLDHRPGLARSWSVSADGLAWTFELRRGVVWADGAPFTVDDVLFTFEAVYDEATGSPARDGLSLDGAPFRVTKAGSHTVVIETPRPFGPMLHALATSAEIVPRHLWEPALRAGRMAEALGVATPPDSVFGTGPFRLETKEPGRTVLARNPHHWRFDRAGTRLPYVDRLVFSTVGDYNGWRLRFDAKEVDAYLARPEEVDELRDASAAGGFRVADIGPRFGTIHFWLNQNPGADERGVPFVDPAKLAWFRDLRFRRALAHAIDRGAIVQTVYRGHGTPIRGPVSPSDTRWFNPDIPDHPYDPARARALLAEMGLADRDGDGFLEDADGRAVAFTFHTNVENQVRIAIARLIETDLAAVGVRATLAPLDFNTLITTIHETSRYEACLLSFASSGDPSSGMNIWLSSGRNHEFDPRQPSPRTAWEREVDSLATASVTATDFAERKRLFDRVQFLFAENLGFIYLANDNVSYAIRDRFVNVRPGRLRAFNEFVWNAEEIAVRDPS